MDANVKISVTMEIPGATRHFSFMRRKKITMQDTSVDVLPEKLANKRTVFHPLNDKMHGFNKNSCIFVCTFPRKYLHLPCEN